MSNIEDATMLPELNYNQRNWQLNEAIRIATLIKNEASREIYEAKIRKARTRIKL